MKTVTILMTKTERGSNDGVTVSTYKEGDVYEVSESLAAAFESMGVAVLGAPGPDLEDLNAAQLSTIAAQLGADTVEGATEEEVLAVIDAVLAEDTIAGAVSNNEAQTALEISAESPASVYTLSEELSHGSGTALQISRL